MVRKILLLVMVSLCFFSLPVRATPTDPAETIKLLDQTEKEAQGAKRFSPVLDLFGEELARMGIRLMDNVVYSMDRLWQDTINWNIAKKPKN